MVLFPILQQAWNNTKHALSASPRAILVSVVTSAGIFALQWWLRGGEKAMDEFFDYAIAVAAAIGFVLIPVFMWNLWLAPYRIVQEQLSDAIRGSRFTIGHSPTDLQTLDASQWMDIQVFQLGDAACLWVGIAPHNPIEDIKALAAFKRLSGAAIAGSLQIASPGLGAIGHFLNGDSWWPKHTHKVSSISLRKYADSIGEVPDFLRNVNVPPEITDSEGIKDDES